MYGRKDSQNSRQRTDKAQKVLVYRARVSWCNFTCSNCFFFPFHLHAHFPDPLNDDTEKLIVAYL